MVLKIHLCFVVLYNFVKTFKSFQLLNCFSFSTTILIRITLINIHSQLHGPSYEHICMLDFTEGELFAEGDTLVYNIVLGGGIIAVKKSSRRGDLTGKTVKLSIIPPVWVGSLEVSVQEQSQSKNSR
jgi:hypothetical protein